MTLEIYLIAVIVALVVIYLIVPRVAAAYLKYRGKRVITCPETRRPAGIEVDAAHAAFTAAVSYPDLRLKSCSRWPEREDCGEECLLQVELSPQDCLVRKIVTDWYEGKQCVSCGLTFGKLRLLDYKPGLLSPEGRPVGLNEVAAEELPELLATHFPVCWDCHTTEIFCHQYPEMITDRSAISAGVHRDVTVNGRCSALGDRTSSGQGIGIRWEAEYSKNAR